MKVYQVRPKSSDYLTLILNDDVDYQVSDQLESSFAGSPVSKNWLPVEVEEYIDLSDTVNLYQRGDYPGFWVPVFSFNAVERMRHILLKFGELLPLVCANGNYFAYNITEVCDVLDEAASTVVRSSSDGRVIYIKRHAFHDSKINDLTIFKIPQFLSRVYCTEVFLDSIENHGIEGLRFELLYDSDK